MINKLVINLKRFAMDSLLNWKNKKNKKTLIIRGARQVGKTWLMKEFAKNNYEKVAYINFENNDRMKRVFESDYDIERLILALKVETNVNITPKDTLILFDEIQEVPKALTSLKYFSENTPEYQIIAAGSLLGVAIHGNNSFPVGKVEFLNLFPLNFREFLFATGNENLEILINKENINLMTSFKSKYIDLLKQYYFIGGMPEVVRTFLDNQDYVEVRKLQKDLLDFYELDFSKHSPVDLVPRLRMVWNSIPSQLAKEQRKFVYGMLRKGARAREFELAIQWLINSGLVEKIFRITNPSLPIKAYQDFKAFKLFCIDIGLLSAMSDLNFKTIIEGDKIFNEFKGAITEQYVLQQLVSELSSIPYYYTSPNSSGEIDFVIQKESEIIPIEVKASENLHAKSLKAFFNKFNPKFAVRTSLSDYRKESWLINIPLYAIKLIKNIENL